MGSPTRSERLYHKYVDAALRFDYFVTGVAVALVGYLGANLEPAAIGLTAAGLEALAAFALLGSAFAGLWHLQAHLEVLKLNFRKLHADEVAGAHAGLAASGRPALNEESGDVVTPNEAMLTAGALKVASAKLKKELEDQVDRTGTRSRWRNGLLISGMLLLIVSRVLPAYL